MCTLQYCSEVVFCYRHSIGDSGEKFTIQSGGKCFSYAACVDECGIDKIHKHVGKEPSGKSFNSLVLNDDCECVCVCERERVCVVTVCVRVCMYACEQNS